jgi:hypothetical protein
VLPDWAVRIVVISLLLPALLVAVDALARARRRRVAVTPGLLWLAAVAVVPLVAWLWLRLLGVTGALGAPDGPVLPDTFPIGTAGIVAMVTAVLFAGLACVGMRLLVRRQARGAVGGLPVATGVLICALAFATWLRNPYAAALLVPATHLWLFAGAGWRARWGALAIVAGLVLPLVAVGYYELALSLGPGELAWGAVLAAAGGGGFGSMLLLAGFLAALAGLVRVLAARRHLAPGESAGPAIRTRGPVTYAGPGSLGGTESALRR